MNNLILFTNRSGSTLLTDIIAYNSGSVNLGEGLHSLARNYNYNTDSNRETFLYKTFSSSSITGTYHNMSSRGSDHIGYFAAKQKRIELLKDTGISWTVKENLEKQTMDFNFIKHCADNGVNIYLTHRADVVGQFISKINARYRTEIAKFSGSESQFIYTNKDQYRHYDQITVNFTWLHMYTNVFIEQLLMWRVVYEILKNYKNFKLVSYEKQIKPMVFSDIGINSNVVERYKNETKHLVPTPNNIDKVVITDDHPFPTVGAWEQSLFYIQQHKYLVEV